MDANIFQPAYDPNRMPQRLGISKIEETILNQFVSLQEDLIGSVIFGSDFMQDNVKRSVDDERTNPSYRDLFLRLDYDSLDIMQNNFCEKGIEEFERLKRDLRDAQTEEGTLLWWDMEKLWQDPYAALHSWEKAYWTFLHIQKKDLVVNPRVQVAFLKSTMYLLCLFSQGASADVGYNPMRISSLLSDVLLETGNAVWTLNDVYPPINRYASNVKVQRTTLPIYDVYSFQKTKWLCMTEDEARHAKEIFVRHIRKSQLQMTDDMSLFVDDLILQAKRNAKVNFLFPFVCTKLFAELLRSIRSAQQSNTDAAPDFSKIDIFQYETLNRLYNRHQSKPRGEDQPFSERDSQSIISVMQDLTALAYRHEKRKSLLVEFENMNQVNTNWLVFCLYGRNRYFQDLNRCQRFSGLTLPILLDTLFLDEELELSLDEIWLEQLLDLPEIQLKNETTSDLRETLTRELDTISPYRELAENPSDEDQEKLASDQALCRQLGTFIFCPDMWKSGNLKEDSNGAEYAVEFVNRLIAKVSVILQKHEERPELASSVARHTCFEFLFSRILAALTDCLETLSDVNEQWRLFVGLELIKPLVKEVIDERMTGCSK